MVYPSVHLGAWFQVQGRGFRIGSPVDNFFIYKPVIAGDSAAFFYRHRDSFVVSLSGCPVAIYV